MMLTEKRKADRSKMADTIQGDWLGVPGFTCERLEPAEGWPGKRCTMLHLAGKGVRLSVDFDGASTQPDVFVLAWNIATDCSARFAISFGDINRHHRQKSTDVAYGFADLRALLGQRISQIQNGEAFESSSAT